MTSADPRTELVGRRLECRVLEDLLEAVRAGRSSVLVLRGEPGIGKTALLSHMVNRSEGCRTLSIAGIQSEAELSYAGLHQLCAPLVDGLDALPEPQRHALGTAFGLRADHPPSRLLVGLATLSLLANAAERQPLVCVIDDAQWLDHASIQALEFVARRLLAESVLMVFAVRAPNSAKTLSDLPELNIAGLSNRAALALFSSIVTGAIDERVRDRIVAESRGNPLALHELPRGLAAGALAGGFSSPDARPLSGQIEQGFVRQVLSLDPDTRGLMVVAAADPVGDVAVVRRACEEMGIDLGSASVNAEASGLIALGVRVRFRHPLIRSAAYRSAAPEALRDAHRALAEATDARAEPERRAWHLARAAASPDESLAAELEHSAERAEARGGIAAAAAFLERAAELTPDAERRGLRALAAAEAKCQVGDLDSSMSLASAAELGRLDDHAAARLLRLRAEVMFVSDNLDAALPLLLEAAQRFQGLDDELARSTYRKALHLCLKVGRLPSGGAREVAMHVLSAPRPMPATRESLLLEGLAHLIVEGYPTGAPALAAAVADFRTYSDSAVDDYLGWLGFACRLAFDAWDFTSVSEISRLSLDRARAAGDLTKLPTAILYRMQAHVLTGNLAAAGSLLAEAEAIGSAYGLHHVAPFAAVLLEPWRGREASMNRAIAWIETREPWATEIAENQYAAAVLYNGLGRHQEALDAAKRGCDSPEGLGLSIRSTVELVEAAARLGRSEEAAAAVGRIGEMAAATGSEWALASSARVRALVSEGQAAERLFRESIDRLNETQLAMELARVQLCYGEWLRRQGRRNDARRQLGAAYEMLTLCGADAFAQRAHRELRATGTTLRRGSMTATVDLTPQEGEIAKLAADGLTNPEIGARLYLSRHTVEWHLRKVFNKLGVASRREIGAVLSELGSI